MPLCSNCGVYYLDGEFHECRGGQTAWRAFGGGMLFPLLVSGAISLGLFILIIGICGGFP